MQRLIFIITVLISGLLCQGVQADELHLIINGKAIHLNDGDYNENNWGAGLEYDFEKRGNWIPFINGSFFKDSNDETSKYLGGGAKYRFPLGGTDSDWHIDAGLIAFLMTRKDYKDNDPFFGALPFVSVGTSAVALNATYIPSVSPKHQNLLFFQVQVRLAQF